MSSEPTVFLVEDDASVLEALSLSLTKRGFSVQGHSSAEAFLESYDPVQPGCLVLDLRLTGMTGLELQKALDERQATLPIIFISGHGDIPSSVKAIKAGAVDFLEKPIRPDLLLERINEALTEDARNREVELNQRPIKERFEKLTAREREILGLLSAESAETSSKVIARKLDISPRTVESHRARIMDKMEAKSISDLVSMAKICGL